MSNAGLNTALLLLLVVLQSFEKVIAEAFAKVQVAAMYSADVHPRNEPSLVLHDIVAAFVHSPEAWHFAELLLPFTV